MASGDEPVMASGDEPVTVSGDEPATTSGAASLSSGGAFRTLFAAADPDSPTSDSYASPASDNPVVASGRTSADPGPPAPALRPAIAGTLSLTMWCGLCGCECRRRDGSATSTSCLPLSGRAMGDVLAELGHSVLEGALLCLSCVTLVKELDWVMRRTALTRDKITKRAQLKAENDAIRLGTPTQGTKSEATEVEGAKLELTETAAVKDEPTGRQPSEDGSAESAAPRGEEEEATQAPPPARARRRSRRRLTKTTPPQPKQLGQGDGWETEADPTEDTGAERVTGWTPGGDNGTVTEASQADPNAVKHGPMEAGEPMDVSGGGDAGGGGDGVTADSNAEGPDSWQGHNPADPNLEMTEDSDEWRLFRHGPPSGHPQASRGSTASKRPDWNERWRSKRLKETSWRDSHDGGGHFSQLKRAFIAAQLPEQSTSEPVEPAARVKVEPGTVPEGGACVSGGPPADGALPGKNLFRVGRKVVTKQIDGSATPAVKVMRQDRRGQPKVAFLDHKTALRQAARMDRMHEVRAKPDHGPTTKSNRPPKRRPRVMTKPAAEGPPLLPSEVGWMAAGAADHTWLAGEGAVHAVLDVQPGEAWVDAIVRSEAAVAEGWADDAAQMPVPLANIKAEPPE